METDVDYDVENKGQASYFKPLNLKPQNSLINFYFSSKLRPTPTY